MAEKFAGDKKYGVWLLASLERKLRDYLIPFVPSWMQTYHLTLSTILWGILVVVFSFLARYHIQYLWGVSLMIILQYLTDLLDGQIGRIRKTGLIKWGYYMDHFLDYLFLTSIVVGYGILLPMQFAYILFFVQAVLVGYMISAFLQFGATNEFHISHLGVGPTEVRLTFIAINTLLIFFDRTHLVLALPYVLFFGAFGLFVVAYNAHKLLWKIDMDNKNKS